MTTYIKVEIEGIEIDIETCNVKKSLGEINTPSKFILDINNYNGDYSSSYNIGDEVKIYADVDTNPATTQIFLGIIENVELKGKQHNERLTLSGRDYSSRLIDRTVEPEVYNNIPAGSIINDIIIKYTDDITTGNVSSGADVDRIIFNHTPVYDAIKQLASFNNYMFYVDNSKDLHFKEKSLSSSGYTFGSGNTEVTKASFKTRRDTMFNEVWVYGDRYLDGYTETFTGVVGSNYTLGYKPSNTTIINSGTIPEIIQPGGIYQMTFDAGSQYKYLVNYTDKKIILTSGTLTGDNRYIGSDLIINYMRDLPIVKYGDNDASIGAYGRRVKVIQDTNIRDPLTAESVLLSNLNEFSEPVTEGNLYPKDIIDITPGDTCVVNIPLYEISGTTYDIIEANYNFTKRNMLADEVLNIRIK